MFKRNVEVERLRPLIIRYCRRLDFPGQVVLVTIRGFEYGFDPSFGGCDGGNAANQVHGDYSLIISHPHCNLQGLLADGLSSGRLVKSNA